jgi:hypothetical protein
MRRRQRPLLSLRVLTRASSTFAHESMRASRACYPAATRPVCLTPRNGASAMCVAAGVSSGSSRIHPLHRVVQAQLEDAAGAGGSCPVMPRVLPYALP